jgi:hypothetical protein
MTQLAAVRASAPPLTGAARGFVRWVCTSNPFYVLSAGLFLAGLWVSFEAQAGDIETWALMSGLAGYTLLLAVTACLLVRFGNVWDDVRTVLLLVVLMFLATSVTFDEVLILNPGRGLACYLLGLSFAIAVSEGVLRGIRLRLPTRFRLPYYLILALFFLYPLALTPLVNQPHSEALMWGLFGFSAVAGLVFLTLLPAIRRGPDYVLDNGSPWRWPLYPWVLFGLLAFAVPARSFLLCWSMHLLNGADRHQLIFGPYFVIPFGLAVAVLLLEIGLVSHSRVVQWMALIVPAGLLVLARVGHRPEAIYQAFLEMFTARLGGDPLFLTLLAATGFYLYASLRRVPFATEAVTAALAGLAIIGPETLKLGRLIEPRLMPILAAAALQLALGLWWRSSWRCLLGGGGLALAAALAFPGVGPTPLRGPIAFHLALFAIFLIGAIFNDGFAQLLRALGSALVLLVCFAVMALPIELPPEAPRWVLAIYPGVMACALAAYALWLGYWPALAIASLILASWLIVVVGRGYAALRVLVSGLDYLVLSLLLFALAVLISLGKSGLLGQWIEARRPKAPPTTD